MLMSSSTSNDLDLGDLSQSYLSQDSQRTENLTKIRSSHAGHGFDDDEYDSTLMARISVRSPNTLKAMTNFTELEIRDLYSVVQSAFESHPQRGRKPKYSGLDAFLLLLICFKFAEQWVSFAEKFLRRLL